MTDKEILDEVYKMCCNPFERCDVKSFIEQEWQRADEEETTKWEGSHQTHPYGYFSNSWYSKDKKFKNRNDV